VDPTEASETPAHGGDRTDSRRRRPGPVGPVLAVLVIVGLALGNAWWAPTAGAAGSTHAPRPARVSAGPSSPFTVRLGVAGKVPPSELSLSVAVYHYLTTPTAFDETLGGTPVGSVLARTDTPIPLSSLAADGQHGVDLSVPLVAGGEAGPGTGPFTADLHIPYNSNSPTRGHTPSFPDY
jgi:hypothetical protein